MLTFVIESFLFDASESVRLSVVFAFCAHSSYWLIMHKEEQINWENKTEKMPATIFALIELENELYGMDFVEISVPKCSIAGL